MSQYAVIVQNGNPVGKWTYYKEDGTAKIITLSTTSSPGHPGFFVCGRMGRFG